MTTHFESVQESAPISDKSALSFSADWFEHGQTTLSTTMDRPLTTAQNTLNEHFPNLTLETRGLSSRQQWGDSLAMAAPTERQAEVRDSQAQQGHVMKVTAVSSDRDQIDRQIQNIRNHLRKPG